MKSKCEGLDRFCRFDQFDPCYAALGHKLNVLMLLDTSEYDMKIQKRINYNKTTDPVCRVKYGRIKKNECDLYSNRSEVTVINGTLIINRVIRADSGNYTVTLYHSDGTETSTDLEDLEVNVEAPVGSVEVSIICSSSGVMRASCSSEGDQLLYSWTLNGDSLMDGNGSIDLNEGTDGNITCSVKNHVSHGQKTINVKPCVGLDQFCRFNQSDPCYAALGHKLNVLMVLDTSGYDMKIQKRINYNKTTDPVCRVKNDTIKKKECDLYSNRPEVTVINGTLIINRVIRADSGNYTVTLYRSDGTDTSTHLEVNVEAPIGSVEVSIICSSSGVMRASCSSEGDQLLYSWTLNGDSLMDGNSSIDLNEGTDGNITCSVKNHVSHGQKNINVKPCPGPTTTSVTSTVNCVDVVQREKAAPIGSVEVSIICSSSGVMRASCSSEGDQLLYSWTLNGDSLMDGNSSIDLNEGTDGNITCSVKNHVSHRQKTINVKPCPGPTTASLTFTAKDSEYENMSFSSGVSVVFVLVWCFQMMGLFGLLGGFHIYMRHTSGKKQEDQKLRMRRFREQHEHTAEDS
ncbi:hepatocyte cell adhesion molecule-like protein [Labeo rohita]|uniref:Hepatocyte cell adhesion molecule-like protein n=1 Tax=Labeo rohita TaxID=84645 RepID=A0A498NZ86_LABRO|nr:hepatocyte cell adhesion molecule-like protein [Labeo rohita]